MLKKCYLTIVAVTMTRMLLLLIMIMKVMKKKMRMVKMMMMKMVMVILIMNLLPLRDLFSRSRGNSTIQHKEGLLADELMHWCSLYNEA